MKWLVALAVVTVVAAAPRERRQAPQYGGQRPGQQCPPGVESMPDPSNCQRFFRCDPLTGTNMGTEYCQSGLFFDQTSGQCQYLSSPNAPPNCAQQQQQQSARSTGGAPSQKWQLCIEAARAGPPGQVTHVADPNNCRNYFVCGDGVNPQISMPCAAGTLFNVTTPPFFGGCAQMEENGCQGRPLNPEDRAFQQQYMGQINEAINNANQQQGFGPGGQQGGFGGQQPNFGGQQPFGGQQQPFGGQQQQPFGGQPQGGFNPYRYRY